MCEREREREREYLFLIDRTSTCIDSLIDLAAFPVVYKQKFANSPECNSRNYPDFFRHFECPFQKKETGVFFIALPGRQTCDDRRDEI